MTPGAATATASQTACAHCGLAVPAHLIRNAESQQFCCAGCRQVYMLVHEWGFDQYYRLVAQQRGVLEPARVSGRSFEDFDDVALQSEATDELTAERRRTRLYLEGIHCAACVWLVERLPAVLPGVDEVRLNLASAVADVTWRPGRTRLAAIGRALDRLGYTPHIHRASHVQESRRAEDRASLARVGVAVACAMNLMFLHGALYAGEYSGMEAAYATFFRWLSFGVTLPVLLYSARPFFHTALAGVRARVIHIDVPVVIGITVAFAVSTINTVRGAGPLYFDSLAMLVAALLSARQVQRSTQRAALERADSLRGVAFLEFARKLTGADADATAAEVPLSVLSAGDLVEVRSGELVPVDGVVQNGRSSLDNAVLTGESIPVGVVEGDRVNAGATNLGARLVVRVEASGSRTRVGALMAIVEDALSSKPTLLRRTDLLARRFVQVLLVLAVATGAIWIHQGAELAMERVVALLVVACPCALGLSVPLAISVALMRAARTGVFVKNPDALDRLRQVDTVLVDKTGTLTTGEARVVRWFGEDSVLQFARALERESAHSVAGAFQRTGGQSLHLVRSVSDVSEVPGQGISGRLNDREIRVGNRAHMEAGGGGLPDAVERHAMACIDEGLSPVFVSVDGHISGVAGIGDALRPDAAATVAELVRRGIRVRILSGDHPAVVARIGAALALPADDALGGLTPEAKRDIVSGLVGGGAGSGAVAMVGDGVNDAAALALADVGIAVQGGTGATIVAADVVLTREGLSPLLDILDGASRLRRVILRNIAFSLFYNAAAAALAITGSIGPLGAAVLMPVSSVTVVLSSAFTRTFARARPRVRTTAAEV
ncbi:MAG: heavy metal translocating P-type ATPase metal-binding domain-containing protein [Vicinamibacterales bacterium]